MNYIKLNSDQVLRTNYYLDLNAGVIYAVIFNYIYIILYLVELFSTNVLIISWEKYNAITYRERKINKMIKGSYM